MEGSSVPPLMRWRHFIGLIILFFGCYISFKEGMIHQQERYNQQIVPVQKIIKNVLIAESEVEAIGKGFYYDTKTVEMLYEIVIGRKIKSYITHGGASRDYMPDRTLKEIGYFCDFKMKDKDLYGDFVIFDSAIKNSSYLIDTLLEIIQILPEEFGVSTISEGTLVLIEFQTGKEIPMNNEFYIKYKDNPPNLFLYRYCMPVMRPTKVYSIDWVHGGAVTPAGVFKN